MIKQSMNKNKNIIGYCPDLHYAQYNMHLDWFQVRSPYFMIKFFLATTLLTFVCVAQAKPAFTGINFSGVYDCKGSNELVGSYQVTIKLKLNRISSYGKFGAYDFTTQTDNAVTYRGQAAANGNRLALSYKMSEGKYAEITTGIAEMKN